MKALISIVLACAMAYGCGDKKSIDSPPPSNNPAKLEITYIADTHLETGPCPPALCGQRGHGIVKNVGGEDAHNCHVTVSAHWPGCPYVDIFNVAVTPSSLVPGGYGSYQTGTFCGLQNPQLYPAFGGNP